ncbi:MAG: hypothetical protein ACI4S2_15370 [Lachnospiraceae bacterium]
MGKVKLYVKRVVAVGVLASVSLCLVNFYMRITGKLEDGVFYDYQYYVEDDKIDVLCVGSSHAYCSINPLLLFEEYGYAAYDLAASAQTMWISYYYIEEALKSQNPDVIILDIYETLNDNKEFGEEFVKPNLMALPVNYTKYKATQFAGQEDWLSTFFLFPLTHDRYTKLHSGSFDKLDNCYLGWHYSTEVFPCEPLCDPHSVKEIKEVDDVSEEYLKQIIELCKEKNVELLLVNAPNASADEEQFQRSNYVAQFAYERGITFLDANRAIDEIGIDYSSDCMDERHLNYFGSMKYTRWIATYLQGHYNLKDHRYEDGYDHWKDACMRWGEACLVEKGREIESLNELIPFLMNNERFCGILLYNGSEDDLSNQTQRILEDADILLDEPKALIIRGGEVIYEETLSNGYDETIYILKHAVSLKSDGNIQRFRLGTEQIFSLDTENEKQIDVYYFNETVGFGSWNKKVFTEL